MTEYARYIFTERLSCPECGECRKAKLYTAKSETDPAEEATTQWKQCQTCYTKYKLVLEKPGHLSDPLGAILKLLPQLTPGDRDRLIGHLLAAMAAR